MGGTNDILWPKREEMKKYPTDTPPGMDSRAVKEAKKVNEASDKKYPNRNWRDLTIFYSLVKMVSHIFKFWFAGKGNLGYEEDGTHHLGKVLWYIDDIFWVLRNRPEQDDRPDKPVKFKTKVVPLKFKQMAKFLT